MTDPERFEKAKRAMGSKMYSAYTVEALLLKDTCMFLDLVGATYTREADAPRRGVSDIVACYNGKYVAIELKDNTGTPSPQQLKFIDKVHTSGGMSSVCRTLQDVANLLALCLK